VNIITPGALASEIGSGSLLQAEGRGFDSRRGHGTLDPRVHPASNRNEYQKQKNGVERGRCLGLTTSPPSVTQFRKSGNLDVPQAYGPPWPVRGIALLYPTLLYSITFITDFRRDPPNAYFSPVLEFSPCS
jgi:hypothetical protein